MADAVRAAAKGWGVDLFPELDAHHAYSNTATAMRIPDGVTDQALRGTVKKFGIEIAGGQDHLKGKIFRIGTMGSVGAQESPRNRRSRPVRPPEVRVCGRRGCRGGC